MSSFFDQLGPSRRRGEGAGKRLPPFYPLTLLLAVHNIIEHRTIECCPRLPEARPSIKAHNNKVSTSLLYITQSTSLHRRHKRYVSTKVYDYWYDVYSFREQLGKADSYTGVNLNSDPVREAMLPHSTPLNMKYLGVTLGNTGAHMFVA